MLSNTSGSSQRLSAAALHTAMSATCEPRGARQLHQLPPPAHVSQQHVRLEDFLNGSGPKPAAFGTSAFVPGSPELGRLR